MFLGLLFPVRAQQPQETPKRKEERPSLLAFPRLGTRTVGGEGALISMSGGFEVIGDKMVATGRTTVTYMNYVVEADKAMVDLKTLELQAEGNVSLKGPDVDIRANSVRYSFRYDEGVAYGIEGHHEYLHFRVERDEVTQGPAFRRISEKEALLSGVAATACDFPVPHYYIRGTEVIIILKERVFIRNAVLYVGGIPVLYLPAYTRSLVEPSPWSFELGYVHKLGGYLRIGYDYRHSDQVPDYLTPSRYRTRSRGQARLNLDTFTERGTGFGADYEYLFDYGRHRGLFSAYGIRDEQREVPNEEGTPSRWALRWRERSHVTDQLLFQANVDEVSDPDIYEDILDRFADKQTGRMPERRSRFALTYTREEYLARIQADFRDRVGQNFYHDFTQPTQWDYEYAPDPGQEGDSQGVSGRRFGSASRKLPQLDLSTAHVKTWQLPFYYNSDIHALRALDQGLNTLGKEDDAWVNGIDWHQALMHSLRLTERYTWTNRAGIGVSYFRRETDSIDPPIPSGTVFPVALGGITLIDRDTWLTGTRRRSYGDVEDGFLYYDLESRLNARFTNTLEGYLKYSYLDGTDNSLGEFYRQIGDRTAQTDIYQFPLKTNMIEAFLNHFLLYPNISTYGRAGYNLHPDGEIFAYDLISYLGGGTSYTNDAKEITASAGVDLQERQIRDLSDPNEFQQSNLIYSGTIQYVPRHQRWWARLSVFAIQVLDPDPVSQPPSDSGALNQNDTEVSLSPLAGTRLGPKYTAEVRGEYNTQISDWKSAYVIIRRDLHDLEAAIQAGFRRVETTTNNQVHSQRENEIRFSIRIKPPRGTRQAARPSTIRTLVDSQMQAEFVP